MTNEEQNDRDQFLELSGKLMSDGVSLAEADVMARDTIVHGPLRELRQRDRHRMTPEARGRDGMILTEGS